MSHSSPPELQNQLIALIRAFGLHRLEQTPCGQPVAVTEAHALMELSLEEPLSQSELVQRLGLEKSSISRLVRILEKRDWIVRSRYEPDRRVVQILLTTAGQQAAEQLAAARREKFDRVLAAIPKAQRAQVCESLDILLEAIRESC